MAEKAKPAEKLQPRRRTLDANVEKKEPITRNPKAKKK